MLPQLFPYHLTDYVCQVLRITPFKYYCDLLFAVMREEKSYDFIPNFTVRPYSQKCQPPALVGCRVCENHYMLAPQAADIVRVVGIGRNQYIDLMNQCKVTARTQNALESASVVIEAETSSQSTRVLASASALGAAGKKAAVAHQ